MSHPPAAPSPRSPRPHLLLIGPLTGILLLLAALLAAILAALPTPTHAGGEEPGPQRANTHR